MKFVVLSLCHAFVLIPASVAAAQSVSGPSTRDVVEFTRIIQPADQTAEGLRDQIAPDGKRVFIVTRKADVASNRNRYEIQLLYVTADRLAARRPPATETVFSADVADDTHTLDPAVRDVQWGNDRTLFFLARLNGGTRQVYKLDVPTRELQQLTRDQSSVWSYAVSQDMRRVVYAVQVPDPALRDGARSVVVGNKSFWSVNFGQDDSNSQDRVFRYAVTEVGPRTVPRSLGEPFHEFNAAPPRVSISPDGKWALLPRFEPARTARWARQYPMVDDLLRRFGASQREDRLKYYSRPAIYVARRMTAWRLDDGKEKAIVDAPDDSWPGRGQFRRDRLWQANGSSVILAGTHLPLKTGGAASLASHVIEYWPDSDRWASVATLHGRAEQVFPRIDGFELADSGRRRRFQRMPGGGWREVAMNGAAAPEARAEWALRIRQGLNEPPEVEAVGPAGEAVRLTHLNPQFNPATWGAMQAYSWRDAKGRRWDGGLMTRGPIERGMRYPLVIQSHGFVPGRFYLDGSNTADGFTSGFAGRAYLKEGILVLALPWGPANLDPSTDELQSVHNFTEGVRGAIASLVKAGIVDRERVGIVGFGATGERVLDLLAFTDVNVRAATLADGDASTLFAATTSYGTDAMLWQLRKLLNGGTPYGATRDEWVRRDPSLNTHCIKAALRIETYGPRVRSNWDTYAMMRRQYKPVEMVVLPFGGHSLANPWDRMISLQGNVDWYRFWLKGEQRADPMLTVAAETSEALKAQYAAWRQMETLKAAEDVKPRCAARWP